MMAAARAALDLLKTIQARDSEKDGDIMPMPWPEIDALELALGKTQAGSEAKPRVLITVEGGVIQDVTADTDCAVAIIDWDNVHAEDTYRPELFAFDKPDTVVSPADLAELHRVALEEIQQHIPRATA